MKLRQPWKCGRLVGPNYVVGHYRGTGAPGNMVLALSEIDELLWWTGAGQLTCGTLYGQVRRGPYNWFMFLSCVGFLLAAIIHCYFHAWADWCAVFGLVCVSISSPMCDAFCIHFNVYEDGATGYAKTAAATGKPESWIRDVIKEKGASPEVLATDQWNSLTRLADRMVCVLITVPCLAIYSWSVRPSVIANVPYLCVLCAGVIVCGIGQFLRGQNPCGFRFLELRKDGGHLFYDRVMEPSYKYFELCHMAWHVILIVGFCASACDRHQYPSLTPI